MRLMPPTAPPGVSDAPRPPAPGRASGAQVWLVRHPEVDGRAARRAYGNGDVPLSDGGRTCARELAASFAGQPVVRVASSPLERALVLGRAIAEATGAELVIDARLAELWRGAWQGLALAKYQKRWCADAAAYWSNPWRWKGHGGESDEELAARAWAALEAACTGPGTFVIATHYQVLRSIVAAALGLAPARSHALQNDLGHATLLVDGPHGWTLARANVRAPFAPRV